MANFYTGKNVMEAIDNIINESLILKQSKEPPLGPTPKFIFEGKCKGMRIIELKEAIKRYLDSNRVTPLSFLEEYNELVKDLQIED